MFMEQCSSFIHGLHRNNAFVHYLAQMMHASHIHCYISFPSLAPQASCVISGEGLGTRLQWYPVQARVG